MTDTWTRSSTRELIAAYDRLFRSNVPLSKLKDAAFGGRLFDGSGSGDSVAGRSMAWKVFLINNTPLKSPDDQTTAKPPIEEIKKQRKEYVNLLLETLRAPDGSYEDGLSIPGVSQLPRPSDKDAANLQKNNPLGLDEDNPWKEWFESVDLRRTIRQDVERTFPDIEYFRDPDVQAQLTLILYIHSVTHSDIGYRQGMHELLAPIFLAVDYDSVPHTASSDIDSEIEVFCSREWVAADSWALFTIVMDGVHSWYEWREPPPVSLPPPLKTQFRYGGSHDDADSMKPFVAPIVLACQRLQSDLLRKSDPVLFGSMQNAGVEPQIYGIRWLRLLFTREFSLSDAMIIWDGLFATETPFELALWVCVAMLIRIRNQLIPSDYSTQLTYLLRYPPLSPSTETPSSDIHHSVLLLRQAFALFIAPNPSTGASITVENRNLLNIPIEVPEAPVTRRRSARPRRTASAEFVQGRAVNGSTERGSRMAGKRPGEGSQSVQLGLPELIARGLLERGESLGINKTVMNAVSELRKNLPELTNSILRPPPVSFDSYSSFPMTPEHPPEERPPWEPRTRFEMEKEISDLKTLQKRLGEAVAFSVDALLQDEDSKRGEEALKKVKERKREAIESLAYVRDLLNGSGSNNLNSLDEERLFGEEEYRQRKQIAEARQAEVERLREARRSGETPLVRPPEPSASVFVAPSERRERSIDGVPSTDSHPLTSLSRSPPVSRAIPAPLSARMQSATLPRRQSPANPMARMPSSSPTSTTPKFAPWNHTRSDFSSPIVSTSTLPRPPPRSSTAYRPSSVHQRVDESLASRTRQDPLGALP